MIALACCAQTVFAQEITPASKDDLLPGKYPVCTNARKTCIFEDADNSYILNMKKGQLARKRDGKEQYKRNLFGKGDRGKSATLSDTGNVLAVTVSNVTLSRRAFGGGTSPDDLDRSFRIALYNPRSGSRIKDFDLGAFSPQSVSLSADGQLVFTVGDDLERREVKEVRVYNARSGLLVHSFAVTKTKGVELYSNGYAYAGRAWAVAQAVVGEVAIYNSRDPFSIAEYEVSCSAFISTKSLPEQHSIGVLPLVDDVQQEDWVATSGMIEKLKGGGINAVERKNMKELLEEVQLGMSGLFDSKSQISDIGKLLSATHFVFTDAQRHDDNIVAVSRLVHVTTGGIESSCNLICRDCRPQDLFEGVSAVAEHWVGNSAAK